MISCKRVLRMLLETTTELKGKQADETEHNYSCLQRRTIVMQIKCPILGVLAVVDLSH